MGQKPVPPVNIPIPTRIPTKMGGEFTNPNQNGIPLNGFDHHSQMDQARLLKNPGLISLPEGEKNETGADPKASLPGSVDFQLLGFGCQFRRKQK